MQKEKTFPPPLIGKIGWPWLPTTNWRPSFSLEDISWPPLTIVTPSYNQGVYLEETIRSVLLQGYPNLEYFIIDGGSTDNSVEIIKKYEPWLTGWVSEKDRGQSHAINKGFQRATGEWIGWLNSDDCYAPYGIFRMLKVACDTNANFVYGSSVHFGADVLSLRTPFRKEFIPLAYNPQTILLSDMIDQPASLWTRELFEKNGPLREDMHYAFDWDFFIQIASSVHPALCSEIVAVYRHHAAHKSGIGGLQRQEELVKVYKEHLPSPYRTRFIDALPIISLLQRCLLLNQQGKGLPRFLARMIMFFVRRTGLLFLFGLPDKIGLMLGITLRTATPLVERQFGNMHASTVAEALAQFSVDDAI